MNETPAPPLPEPNPVTRTAHRRETFRQITLPFLLAVLVMVGLAVLAILGTSESASRWGSISLIYLICLGSIVALLFIALNAALVYMLIVIQRGLPPRTRQIQDYSALISQKVLDVSDKLAEPFIKTGSLAASLQTLRRAGKRTSAAGGEYQNENPQA